MYKNKLYIISVVGARPNFMKAAAVHKAIEKYNGSTQAAGFRPGVQRANNRTTEIVHKICHTGQHYDEKMSKIFFDDLELPRPDFYLGVGSGSHAEQTGRIMIEFEKVLQAEMPDLVVVVGDVNSTIACTLTAAKLGIKTAHVEAGLRSFDRDMPEELNRLLTDQLADYLFVTEQSGVDNLLKEGIDKNKIFFVGNVMIDSLMHYLPAAEKSDILNELRLSSGEYVLVTLHRPSNVDDPGSLTQIMKTLGNIAHIKKVIFPVHPRTMKNINELKMMPKNRGDLILTEPIGYIDFIALIKSAGLVITDSGGIQEETTYLGVQCINVRNNTERPVTVNVGTNHLTGTDLKKVEETAAAVLGGKKKSGRIPDLWDGKAAERIVEVLVEGMGSKQ